QAETLVLRRTAWRAAFGDEETMHKILAKVALAVAICMINNGAWSQQKLKVGFMLPYTGTYAALGTAIENGFRLQVQEQGGKLGGREVEYVKVDDESEP